MRRVRLRVLFDHGAVNRAQLRESGIQIGSRSEPAEEVRHPMHAAFDHGRVQMMRTGHDVRDDLGLRRVGHGWLEDADDRRAAIAQPDHFSNRRLIAVQSGRPEAVCEHRRASRLRAVVVRVEEASADRAKAHDVEVGAADDSRAHDARLPEPDHCELDGREVTKGSHCLDPSSQVPDLRHRELGVLDADPGSALADVDEPILIPIDERPQKHPADHAEDGRVGANSEGQRDYDRERQALDAGE